MLISEKDFFCNIYPYFTDFNGRFTTFISSEKNFWIKVWIGIFNNITHDHLNYHKNFKNYLNVKKKFFDDLDNNAYSLINSDDKNSKYIIQNTKSKVYTYSISKNADFKLKVVENSFDGLILKIEGIEVNTKLIGKFNAYNLLTVFSASKILKINTEKIFIWKAQPFDTKITFSEAVLGEIIEKFSTGDFIVKCNDGILLVTDYDGVVNKGDKLS